MNFMSGVCAPVARILIVIGLTSAWQPLRAQQKPAPDDLKIVIIEGEGFTNSLKKRIAREPVVEVRDRNDKPVAGASVSFLLPSSGPSGTFANGARSITVLTGPNGRATATAMRANDISGAFKIDVTASYQGQTATTAISQTNTAAAAGGGLSAGATLGIIGAAVAAAAIAVATTVGGKKSSISVGPPSAP